MVSEHGSEPDDGLDAYFDAARDATGPGADLVARVLADAAEVQAEQPVAEARPAPGLLQILGGWITVSGLAAACAAGVAIGVSLPAMLGSGLDGGVAGLFQQEAIGFTSFDAVAFADGGLGE